MWDSIYRLPNDFSNFWDAHFINKAQILFLLFLLYLFGYYSSKLLVNRNILKWGIFIFFFLPFLISIFHSQQIIFILPVALGILKGLFIGNASFNPFGAFEGLMDFFLSVKYRRGKVELQQKYEEAEEILRKAKQYENQARSSAHEQASSKEQFKEEMKRERERQEREAKKNTRRSNSHEDEMRWQNGYRSKPHKEASEEPPKYEKQESYQKQTSSKSEPEVEEDKRSPREVLGLGASFTKVELKKARNEAMQRCHIDKWRGKPKALQKQMEEETKKINWAYEKLK